MNFEQLEIITTLSEEKSFSKTANKLHMTTSAVSQAVANLEKELKIILFDRSKQGSFPTTQGQYVIRNAYSILDQRKDIYTYANKRFQEPKVKLRIGCIPGINGAIIESIRMLQKEYPFVEVSIIEKNTQDLLKDLRQKNFDFALIAFSENIVNHNLQYDIKKVLNGSFYFAVNKNDPIANKEVLEYEDIINEPLAIYDDKFLLNYISHIENKIEKSAHILFQTNNFNSIINTVEQNIAISFGPSYAMINDYYSKLNNIKMIPAIDDKDIISPALWFLQIKNDSLNEIGEELLLSIKNNIKVL